MSRTRLRWMTVVTLAALCGVLSACDRSPKPAVSDEPPELAATRAAAQPAPKSNVEVGDRLPAMRAKAEAGDVNAMLSLARACEMLGSDANKEEARQWYLKAAEVGKPPEIASAKESLAMMDAAAAAATRPVDQANTFTPSPVAVARPTTRAASGTPVNLEKVRWQEILDCFDHKDFDTVARPNYRKRPEDSPIFIGLTSSPEKTMTAAVSGPDSDNLDAVSIVIRVRNVQDVASNPRVRQASSIANTITRGNVLDADFVDWITQYLTSGVKSAPIFRNGWRISVSGTAGEGIADPKKFLGEAVLIEMKK